MANLTSKELTAIEDQLNLEKNLIQKYSVYAQNCTDPAIRSKFQDMANVHRGHLNKLLTFLN